MRGLTHIAARARGRQLMVGQPEKREGPRRRLRCVRTADCGGRPARGLRSALGVLMRRQAAY